MEVIIHNYYQHKLLPADSLLIQSNFQGREAIKTEFCTSLTHNTVLKKPATFSAYIPGREIS
jgi:hypothetical protein